MNMKESNLIIYRVLAVVIVLVHLLGWAMFYSSLGWLMHSYALAIVIAFGLIAFCNKNVYAKKIRFVLFGIYVLAMSITVIVLINDMTASYTPDIGAIIIRGIVFLILGILAKEAIYNKRKG